jgi:hypothetical protein
LPFILKWDIICLEYVIKLTNPGVAEWLCLSGEFRRIKMFCPACGNEIPNDSKFCEHCGEKSVKDAGAPKPAGEPKQDSGWTSKSMDSESPTNKEILPEKRMSSGGGGAFNPREIQLDPIQLLKEAWAIVSADLAPIAIFTLIYLVVVSVCAITIIGGLAVPGFIAGYMICIMGYIRRKEQLDYNKMLKDGWPFYVNMLVYVIVAGIISSLASVCLVIPGLIVGAGFGMSIFLIVDKNASFGDAINAAFALISKQYMMLLIFGLVLLAVYIIPALLAQIPVLGWIIMFAVSLVASPMFTIMFFKAYQKLYD